MPTVIIAFGQKHCAKGHSKLKRTVNSVVPMQPSYSLEQKIHWAELGYKPVEIKVKRLHYNLCCNHNAALTPTAFWSETRNCVQLFFLPMLVAKTGMKQIDRKFGFSFQFFRKLLSIIDKITDNRNLRPDSALLLSGGKFIRSMSWV
jgi:hypothetical protein